MENIARYISFIQEAEKLKSILRTAWSSSGREESTAEHSWRLALLAGIVLKEYPQFDGQKVLMMCLIHDMGEIYDGDISAALLPDAGEKFQMEFDAVQQVFGLLPEEQRDEMMALWQEYNDDSSPEAHLVKALDKAETIIQHNQGLNPPEFDYDFNLEYGTAYFKNDPFLQKMRNILDEDTSKRWQEEQHIQNI